MGLLWFGCVTPGKGAAVFTQCGAKTARIKDKVSSFRFASECTSYPHLKLRLPCLPVLLRRLEVQPLVLNTGTCHKPLPRLRCNDPPGGPNLQPATDLRHVPRICAEPPPHMESSNLQTVTAQEQHTVVERLKAVYHN